MKIISFGTEAGSYIKLMCYYSSSKWCAIIVRLTEQSSNKKKRKRRHLDTPQRTPEGMKAAQGM